MDECVTWGNQCPHMCHNVKGSFKCMCYAGFSDVKGKGTVCKAEGMTLHHLQHKYHTFIDELSLAWTP